ncbi:hypothetical protein L195_g017150 [Trifolium pratense]|uniref:Uncharacterized protein n=1 Tax=Trifolium pratense TaxID=57577 RepID=A0A2K3MT57_TRIPR|nr:hypothetical protein L195_g017150 [Trifolium pratense]
MQNEMENLEWNQKKLQERFQMAVKECKMMEMLLAELEEEHDMAIAKIENLEGKLRDQINENLRLKEIQGKAYWNSKDPNIDNDRKIDDKSHSNPSATLQWKSGYRESGDSLQDLLMNKDNWEDESKTRTDLLKLLKPGLKSAPANSAAKPVSKDIIKVNEVLDHHRDVAISQSIFSAILSLIVGVTVWGADDPCMPLIIALFAVVGMSLKSVVKFFFSIRNKPASDAVALLSFNWFILGTLTYPTLPRVAPMLAPLVLLYNLKYESLFVVYKCMIHTVCKLPLSDAARNARAVEMRFNRSLETMGRIHCGLVYGVILCTVSVAEVHCEER